MEEKNFDYLFDKIDAGEELSSREKRYLIKNYEIERTIVCPSQKGRFLYVTSLCLYKNENYYKNKYYIIVPILIGAGFIFTFTMIFSPKLRSKFMGHQIKSMKYMLDDNKNE